MKMYFDWRVGDAVQQTDYDAHLLKGDDDSEAQSRKSVQILKGNNRMSKANREAENARFYFKKQKNIKSKNTIDDYESLHTSVQDSMA